MHQGAKFIVEILAKNGFVAYYAGGWVRDFLLKHPSDDIDIATSAPPETVQALFPHTVPIGIAFGIVLVVVEGHSYEVATFRQDFDYQDGRRPKRVEFSREQEDAHRRDFTINGMFYDPIRDQVIDYVHGQEDLQAGIIRAIGNPHERIREDRLRMVRAIRMACRFGFIIEPHTAAALRAHAAELFPAVAIERIVNELEKGLAFRKLSEMLRGLHEYELLEAIFPALRGIASVELEKRMVPLQHYPVNAPLIAWLLPLFAFPTLEPQLELTQALKLPNLDRQFITFAFHARELLQKIRPIEDLEWAYFYANRFSQDVLLIAAAHKMVNLEEHEVRRQELQFAIDRIVQKRPLVQGKDLMEAGVVPGKEMGELLMKAERIAINQRIEDPLVVIKLLRIRR
jgi:poly(A) polymerase